MSIDLEKLSKHLHDTTPERMAEKEITENAEAIKAALARGEDYPLKSVPYVIKSSVELSD
jgi:hypothetical protein